MDSFVVGWIQDLYNSDLFIEGDSTRYPLEKEKQHGDSAFRQLVYPKRYTWTVAVTLINKHELKKAFWYFIILYGDDEANKGKVLTCFLTNGKLFKIDEVIFNTFYTYSNTNSEISKIKDGEATIFAPHFLEEKRDAMIDILAHINQHQIQKGLIEYDDFDGHDHGEGSDHQYNH